MKPSPKDWPAIIHGSERFPKLLDFESLDPEIADRLADALAERKPDALAKIKLPAEELRATFDQDLLAYEEAHRAWANWRSQIDESMGGRARFRRVSGKSLVTLMRNWTVELLRERIQPGHFFELVTPMITGSPTFNPTTGFSFPYMFGQWAIDKVALAHRSRGRINNAREAGRDKRHSFVGQVDTRVLDFLRTVEGFDATRWNEGNVHVVISAARRLASGGAVGLTPAIKLLAVPLSKQAWLADV